MKITPKPNQLLLPQGLPLQKFHEQHPQLLSNLVTENKPANQQHEVIYYQVE